MSSRINSLVGEEESDSDESENENYTPKRLFQEIKGISKLTIESMHEHTQEKGTLSLLNQERSNYNNKNNKGILYKSRCIPIEPVTTQRYRSNDNDTISYNNSIVRSYIYEEYDYMRLHMLNLMRKVMDVRDDKVDSKTDTATEHESNFDTQENEQQNSYLQRRNKNTTINNTCDTANTTNTTVYDDTETDEIEQGMFEMEV